MRVLSVGNANVDLIMRARAIPEKDQIEDALSITLSSGGSASNYSYAMAALGESVEFVGAVGKDLLGEYFLGELRRLGVGTKYVQRTSDFTGLVTIWLDSSGEKSGLAWRGANLSLMPEASWKDFLEYDVVHIAGASPHVAVWIVENLKVFVTFDLGSAGARYRDEEIAKVVVRSDVSYFSEAQLSRLQRFTGRSPERLASDEECVIIKKMGERGVEVYSHMGSFYASPYPTKPVDTTGAGDVFSAVFDRFYIATGDPKLSCERALAASSIKIRYEGAKNGVPTISGIESFIRENGPVNFMTMKTSKS